MEHFMLMIASSMPIDMLLENLMGDIKDYQTDNTPGKLSRIEATCSIILSKKVIELEGGGHEGLKKVMDRHDLMSRGADLLDPSKH